MTVEELGFLHWLVTECGYRTARPLGGGRYSAVMPLAFTHAVVVGRIGDMGGYDDRWCYETRAAAEAAFVAWDGRGEPTGWHRNPRTGRRRTDGDPAKEYVAA